MRAGNGTILVAPAVPTSADDDARNGVRAARFEAPDGPPPTSRERTVPGTPVPANPGYVSGEPAR